MCKSCLFELSPKRDTYCLDSGSYLINFKGCANCGKRDVLKEIDKVTEPEEDEEHSDVTTYKHVCSSCDHPIAKHFYSFKVEDNYQEYMMDCPLCGYGQSTHSVLPVDPRKIPALY